MSEPLTAPYKLELGLTVGALLHKMKWYCDAASTLSVPSGWALANRLGTFAIDVVDAAQHWWTVMRPLYDAAVNAPNATLYARAGGNWNPVFSAPLTGVGTSSGVFVPAEQYTISMRTVDFKRIRADLMETSIKVPLKNHTYAEFLITATTAFGAAITGADSDPDGFFEWARNKSDQLVAISGAFVSATSDVNDKLRRARGLA